MKKISCWIYIDDVKSYVLEAWKVWKKRRPKAAIALIGHVTCLEISSADDDCGAFCDQTLATGQGKVGLEMRICINDLAM